MSKVEKHQCAGRVYPDRYPRGYPCSTNAKYMEPDRDGAEVWWCHHHAPSKIKAKEEAAKAKWDANQGADEVRRQQAVDRGKKLQQYLGVKFGPQWNGYTKLFTGGVTISPDECDKLIDAIERSMQAELEAE